MPTTVQLNTRIAPELKRQGDAVFAREGLTSSEVVRAVWEYAARTQQVPACVKQRNEDEVERRVQSVREGAGLASKVARSMGLTCIPATQPCGYETLRDEMYDELSARMEARHV